MDSLKKIYFCFATDRDFNGSINKFFILCVALDKETEPKAFEILGAMTPEEIYNNGIKPENLKITSTDGKITADFIGFATRYPSVYQDSTGIHLTLKAFTSKYHRLNPNRLWPQKPDLMRTITVIGETRHHSQRYINYWMTNRKMQILDKSYTEFGYYVCDYNGSVSYLTFEQMQSIGNRYGFTNAKISGNRIVKDDGTETGFMMFDAPSEQTFKLFENVSYLGENHSTNFEIKILRFYADTFFVLRRRQFSFLEGSQEEKTAIDELRESIEAFHQALIHSSVPEYTYKNICEKVNDLFPNNDDSGYKKMKKELLNQIPCLYFKETAAFSKMMENRGGILKKIITLQTFVDLSPNITEQYCAIMLAEQEITELLESMAEPFGFELKGLDYRLKSPDSLYEKLYERVNDTGKTIEQLFAETRDILRYTVCFKRVEDYCSGVQKVLEQLMGKYGGQLECFRNYWAPYVPGDYKGVNASVRLPDMNWDIREHQIRSSKWDNSRFCVKIPSFCFEVQFHTCSSFEMKEENHKLYELNRRADVSDDEREKNRKIMQSNMQKVVYPDGAQFLDLMSNEYIIALRDSIHLMESELVQIKQQEKDNPFVDTSLCD